MVFCTGKVYYELTKERKNRGMDASVAIARIEQVEMHTHVHSHAHTHSLTRSRRTFLHHLLVLLVVVSQVIHLQVSPPAVR